MEKLHMIIDLGKCVGCFSCLMACKDEHVGNAWLPYTDAQQKHVQKWIEPVRHERGKAPYTDLCFVPTLCQHCDDAPCQKALPKAVIKRDDGIVLLDAQEAKDNKKLAAACPYGRISWNEDLKTAQKCTMCAHLLDDGWKEPRCVQACPLRALSIIKCEDSEFETIVQNQSLKPITDGLNKPRVLYKNLEQYTSNFIAGALTYMEDGIEKAAQGAKIRLCANDIVLKEIDADFFGEFKFDYIPSHTGEFQITCVMEGCKPLETTVTMDCESICLEPMQFENRG